MRRTLFIGGAAFFAVLAAGVLVVAARGGATQAAPANQWTVATARPAADAAEPPAATGQPCPHGGDAAAMREHMDAVHGPGSFDRMEQKMGTMHGGQPGRGPGGMMGAGQGMMR